MIKALALILILASLGGALADLLHLPLPGAAIGLVFLTAHIFTRGEVDSDLGTLFDGLCPHFPLFLLPAAVGIVANAQLLASAWLQVTFAVALGTLATIVVTGWLTQFLMRARSEVEKS